MVNIRGHIFVRFASSGSPQETEILEGKMVPIDSARPLDFSPYVLWQGGKWSIQSDRLVSQCRNIQGPKGSALLTGVATDGKRLWIAAFGLGICEWVGSKWELVDNHSREVTALSYVNENLWVGTRREGAYSISSNGTVTPSNDESEIPSHVVVSLFKYLGVLYACSLEDGLARWTGEHWSAVIGPSTQAPRQAVEFRGRLYLRNGNGVVDCFDGVRWTHGIEKNLRRPQCSALAVSGSGVLFGEWGGFSKFDGQEWTHELGIKSLQGKPVTCLAETREGTWIGTQGAGLVHVLPDRSAIRLGLGAGLKDDWVTGIVARAGVPIVSTFSGGVVQIVQGRVSKVPTHSNAVRGIFAGKNLWFITATGVESMSGPKLPTGLTEVQAVIEFGNDLWVGCRTGLYRVRLY